MSTHTSSLLEALDLKELLPEEQEDLLLDLNELIFKGSLVRILESMDDDTKLAMEKLLSTNPSEEEIQDFIAVNVPQADQAVMDTVKELTDDILVVTGASQD